MTETENKIQSITETDEFFTSVREAGKYACTTGQALFVAIKKGELKAEKKLIRNKRNRILNQWIIKKTDIDAYRRSKYNREKRTFEGEKLFDIERNRWSVLHASKALSTMLGIPYAPHRLYYQLQIGRVKGSKKAGSWIIEKEEFMRIYHEEYALLQKKGLA